MGCDGVWLPLRAGWCQKYETVLLVISYKRVEFIMKEKGGGGIEKGYNMVLDAAILTWDKDADASNGAWRAPLKKMGLNGCLCRMVLSNINETGKRLSRNVERADQYAG